MAQSDRIRKRLLQQAVEENLETMRGLTPRSLRPAERRFRLWSRRALAVAVPLLLLGSTWLVSNGTAGNATLPAIVRGSVAPAAQVVRPRPLPSKVNFDASQKLDPAVLPLAVKRIVIDAGHGGHDIGTSSTNGLVEKQLTLEIAERLRVLLEKNNYQVLLTRAGDDTMTLQQRVAIANQSDGDLFVSIHLNSLRNPKNRGVETYYLGPTNDPLLKQFAALENRESGYSMADMRSLLDGIYADARQDESQKLAQSIQRELFTSLKTINPALADRGVKTAPFVVLVATQMPSILAEVSCLSNNEEVALLNKPEYKQRIADALFAGIRTYTNHRDLTQKGT